MSNVTVNKGTTGNSTRSQNFSGYKHIGQSERIVSLIAGTTLASSAMRSRSILSAAILLGVSAGLIQRGATGRCGFSKGVDKLNKMLNNVTTELAQRTEPRDRRHDEVAEASEESFPASDAPSFTPVTGESSSHLNM